jgi:hypothetical protein
MPSLNPFRSLELNPLRLAAVRTLRGARDALQAFRSCWFPSPPKDEQENEKGQHYHHDRDGPRHHCGNTLALRATHDFNSELLA